MKVKEKIKKAVLLRSRGVSVKEIAYVFGVSRQTIHNWLKEFRKYRHIYDSSFALRQRKGDCVEAEGRLYRAIVIVAEGRKGKYP